MLMKRIALLLILAVSFFGCSLERKHYSNGFYSEGRQKKGTCKIAGNDFVKHDASVLAEPARNPMTNGQNMIDSSLLAPAGGAQVITQNSFTPICDTIFLKNGSRIVADIVEVTILELRYKLCDLPDGPIRGLNKNMVAKIHHATGAIETFSTGDGKEKRSRKEHTESNSGSYQRVGSYRLSKTEMEEMVYHYTEKSHSAGVVGIVLLIFFAPVAIFAGLVALANGMKAMHLMRGNMELMDEYYRRARQAVIMGIIEIMIPLALLSLYIFTYKSGF